MKIFLSNRERAAGLFIVTTGLLVVAFFVGAAARNHWLAPKTFFHTHLQRGDGLRSGSPVLLSGVEIGEIGKVQLGADERIDVQIVVLQEHAARLRQGTTANVRRILGIGEKRVTLVVPSGSGAVLAQGASILAVEPTDILDVVTELDLGAVVKVSTRMLGVVEKMMATLEEQNRLERLVAAMDRVGPTMDRVNKLIDDLHDPVVALVKDPALHGAMAGADALLSDGAMQRAVRHVASAMEPRRIDRLVSRADTVLDRIEALTGDKGHLPGLLEHADKMLTDGRIDRLIGSMERLTDEKKLARLLDNMSVLAEQSGKVAPEIPHLAKELNLTLREAVIVLKALQKTWVLEGKSDDARKEIQRDRDADKKPAPDGAP